MRLTSLDLLDLAMDLAKDHLHPSAGRWQATPSGAKRSFTMRYLAGPSAEEEGLRVLAVEHGTSLKEARTRLSLRLLARVIRKVAGVTKVTIEFEKGEALVEGPSTDHVVPAKRKSRR